MVECKEQTTKPEPKARVQEEVSHFSSDLDETSSVDSLDTGSLDTGNSLVLDDWDALNFDDNM